MPVLELNYLSSPQKVSKEKWEQNRASVLRGAWRMAHSGSRVLIRWARTSKAWGSACSSCSSSPSTFQFSRRHKSSQSVSAAPTSSVSIDPYTWKDTAFTNEKRQELGLRGLLPPGHQTMAQQVERTLYQMRVKKVSPLPTASKSGCDENHANTQVSSQIRRIWASTSS
jgi:hypothetical protein